MSGIVTANVRQEHDGQQTGIDDGAREAQRRRGTITTTNAPTMNTSPWAKLMSSMMP